MKQNLTALICCFTRLYHTKNSKIKIYNDTYAHKIISEEEFNKISEYMKNGIKFFNLNYDGNDPLKWIVNNNLAPSILARSIFNEKHLLNEIKLGLKQYIILGSGYDTSSFKVNNKVKIFEIDKKEIIEDKIARIKNSKLDTTNITYIKTDFNKNWIKDLLNTDFDSNKKTFCSLLGISYYLDFETFKKTIKNLSNNIPKYSIILFDYPNNYETDKEKINQKLAKEANEEMKAIYTYQDIEEIAKEANMLIYEHLDHNDVDKNYFNIYNELSIDKIKAPKGVSYAMLIKN